MDADRPRFRILGPLEAETDDGPLRLGGPKPRAVLAALLLRPGEVVSTDHLVAAAWGDEPPRDAAGTLQAYVSRLRSALDPSAVGLLRHCPPGYVLHIPEDHVDAAEFARLVAGGLARAEAGQRGAAVELWGEALALWRGPPLAEFDAARIDPDSRLARLQELWLVAVEERAGELVRLGRGREVTAQLEALVARLPTRERLSVVLMEALYASGRQADALAAYRALRTYLVDELGVEPSEAARRVHVRVLAQDASLAFPGTTARHGLPRPRHPLVGRTAELAGVGDALARSPLVTLVGVGGVGKTRLALEAASREGPRFADGARWCELAPLREAGRVDDALAAALGVQLQPGITMEQALVGYLADRHVLVVLDNCEHLLSEVVVLVDRLLAECPGLAVLATSRESLAAEGEHVWRVPPLCPGDATALFVQRASAVGATTDAGPGDTDAVTEICRRLEGLPLAIELAAARTRAMSAHEVLRHLDDATLLAERSRTRPARQTSLTATIDWSYRLLTSTEQRLFDQLSVFAGGAHLEAVHAVCGAEGAPETGTLDLLTALVDKSMVVVSTRPGGDSRYRVLEMLRAYGQARLPDDAALSRRHAGYFTGLAELAARGVQGPDEARWIERMLPEADNLRTAFEQTIDTGDAELALRLCSALPEVLQLRLGYEAAGWAERALAMASLDQPRYVATIGAAARGAWNVGDFDRARRLAERADAAEPPRGTARTGYPGDVLADIALYQGDVDTTMRHYAAAAADARERDDPIRLVWSLYYLAICHAVRRRSAQGLPIAEECLAVAEHTANPTSRSMGRYALGLVLKKAEPARAVALFDEAARLAASVRNGWWEGIALMEAAATRAVHEDPQLAARALLDVLEHWQRVGDRTQQWLNLRYVVRLLLRLGLREDALTLHHHLLAQGKPSPIEPALADSLGGDAGGVGRAAGRAMSQAQAVGFAKSRLRSAGSRDRLRADYR